METLVVVTKVKKYIKSNFGMNTSSSFIDELSKHIHQDIAAGARAAQDAKRKTVMGRDFSFYVDSPKVEDNLVVVSKIKKAIKDSSGLSTSSQVAEQLSAHVQNICKKAAEVAESAKRKTVMDRDIVTHTNM